MSDADRLERDLEQDREHLRQTLGALEDKMSPGRLLDEAMAYFDTGPKAFASDLTRQVRDNPMPTLLTGVGLAWLILGDRKSSQTQSDTAAAQPESFDQHLGAADYDAWAEADRLQQAEWACVRLESEADDAYLRRLDQSRAAALGLAYDPQEDHASFSSRVRDAAEGVKHKGASARDKLKQAAASAKHGAQSAAGSGVHGLNAAASATKGGALSAAHSARQLHESNPIATAAIGIAMGAFLGASIPLSRKEEEALGAMADKGLALGADLSRKAADAAGEHLSAADQDRAAPETGGGSGGAAMV